MPREGTLLPETYKFPRGTSREQVIQRMQQTQKRMLAEIWERRNPDIPVKSPEQLVTLASIIEKETGKADERSRVAAVFVNRLRQKMKLQSDPTIIYGLVGGKGTLGRPIKRSEIQQPSPYNTYVVDGLPPGPIANPGRASLEAAANPARTRDLFFVADGTGGHTFTETYDQHQKNVVKLRAIEKQIQNDTVEPAAEEAQPAAAGAPADTNPTATTTRPARAEEARARRASGRPGATRRSGPAGRGAIDDDASGGSALAPFRAGTEFHFGRKRFNVAVAAANPTPVHSRRNSSDGVVEHDRLCPQPRRQRSLHVRMGIEVGQRQGV